MRDQQSLIVLYSPSAAHSIPRGCRMPRRFHGLCARGGDRGFRWVYLHVDQYPLCGHHGQCCQPSNWHLQSHRQGFPVVRKIRRFHDHRAPYDSLSSFSPCATSLFYILPKIAQQTWFLLLYHKTVRKRRTAEKGTKKMAFVFSCACFYLFSTSPPLSTFLNSNAYLTFIALLVVTSAQHTDVNCHGDATGVAKVSVSGGVAGYTYRCGFPLITLFS